MEPWLGDKVNSGIGLSYQHARLLGWRTGTTTLCRSWLYSPVSDLGIRLLKTNALGYRLLISKRISELYEPEHLRIFVFLIGGCMVYEDSLWDFAVGTSPTLITVNQTSPSPPEKEFLDMTLTKDSSLLRHGVSSTGGFYIKPYSILQPKKSRNKNL